jgi:ABC-2 type transport system ATP-binding protein
MKMTALGAFRARPAGRLSGGMKQKLGLACTLVRSPRLLVLDEPTVGVDPLSRRELWKIVTQLVKDEGLTVLLTTSYLDEAERCDHTLVLRGGVALFSGSPAAVAAQAAGRAFVATPPPGQTARSLQSQLICRPGIVDALPSAGRVRFVTASVFSGVPSSAPRFEDGFMALLHTAELVYDPDLPARLGLPDETDVHARSVDTAEVAIEVENLVRTFGTFAAVDDVTFRVHKGEVFGLLGANGAGKTTTFRMLCGLLPATSGSLRVGGLDVTRSRASVRERLGYMAQKFSLYGALSVRENLDFFARAYGLRGKRLRLRVDWAIEEFELAQFVDLASAELPGGYKQRLALAAALLHEPEMLFLDEPTSGADPVARREFWVRINGFAEQGVTIIVTTHFMEEAEYCDRLLILEAGKVLAEGTPAEIRARAAPTPEREPTMEDAFVSIVEAAQHAAASA